MSDRPSALHPHRIPNYDAECFPIDSLDQLAPVLAAPPLWTARLRPLAARSPTVHENRLADCHGARGAHQPRARLDRRFAPRTLVCHDYRGGYREDRHAAGAARGGCYAFYNWAHVDAFVYFSHRLVTVPPLGWTNAAHRRGVRCLGTLITEGSAGRAVCDQFLADEATARLFASQLARLAAAFGFDGYLLNIENGVASADMLRKFVTCLTLTMHEAQPESLVIWYDSVTEAGELRWQNELNERNRGFFDCCDGIFLNYVWTEASLRKTIEVARFRSLDVYVGVDVFGRNTFGGGMFNSYKAAQVIRRYRLSMAIFAPGWTHETLEVGQQTFEHFINRDSAFWNTLWPYLYTHPITECFTTTFHLGTDQNSFNLLRQEQQLSKIKHPKSVELIPNLSTISNLVDKCKCLQCFYPETGVNLLISKQYLEPNVTHIHNLFICDIFFTETITIYYLCNEYFRKTPTLSLYLLLRRENGSFFRVLCNGGDNKANLVDNGSEMEVNRTEQVEVLNHIKGVFRDLFQAEVQRTIRIVAFQVELPIPCTLLEVGAVLDDGGAVNLCAFGIEDNFYSNIRK